MLWEENNTYYIIGYTGYVVTYKAECTAAPTITPAFEEAGSQTSVSSSENITVSYPSTVNQDELLVLVLATGDGETFTTPSGWTNLTNYQQASFSYSIYYKFADGTESGTFLVTDGTANSKTAQILRYSNVSVAPTSASASTVYYANLRTTNSISQTTDADNMGVWISIVNTGELSQTSTSLDLDNSSSSSNWNIMSQSYVSDTDSNSETGSHEVVLAVENGYHVILTFNLSNE